ncbi:hypothetical protein [Paenibacillus sp. UNC499MF]|uniref:hypothetical protein n=1 Tax=Paenibacillus sp. UNC499MF TaxID=1502751 RepID=UPI00089FFA34|nr:hypothetical protein [Paenibacillus sp. UNC499MF]SEF60918.1 hypothetical protein SAMN02799616_00631 [Paenibacillus sp. UNC499MF]
MSKHIQAYFRTENEAEDVRIRLQTYSVEQLEVGETQGSVSRTGLIAPPAFAGGTSGAVGVPGATIGTSPSPGGFIPVRAAEDRHDPDRTIRGEDDGPLADLIFGDGDDDADNLRYVLTAKVRDSDYTEIVEIIRSNKGYVESID